MTLPVLETERLRLRPRMRSDLEACFAIDREPGTLDWIDWPEEAGSWEDENAHRAFIRARMRGPYPDGMGYWVIATRQAPDRVLGWVLLIPDDTTGSDIEIGWRVPSAVRGQGYAPEAASRFLSYAFADLGLRRVVADIYPQNTASRRVAEKIGMRDTEPTPGAQRLLGYQADIQCVQ